MTKKPLSFKIIKLTSIIYNYNNVIHNPPKTRLFLGMKSLSGISSNNLYASNNLSHFAYFKWSIQNEEVGEKPK